MSYALLVSVYVTLDEPRETSASAPPLAVDVAAFPRQGLPLTGVLNCFRDNCNGSGGRRRILLMSSRGFMTAAAAMCLSQILV